MDTDRAFELLAQATPLAWLRMLRGLGEAVLLRCDRGAGERLKALLRCGGLPRAKETGLPPVRRAA